MSVSYWSDINSKKQNISCDVCIIGAGISGLSVAYWLQKEDPQLKVIVIDKAEMGAGATARNAGFITCGSVEHFNRMVGKHGLNQALEIWRFAEKNMQLLRSEIIDNPSQPLHFEQKGAFSLASSQTEMSELENVATLMEENKIPVETLKQKEVEKRLGAIDFVGGIHYFKDGSIDPLKLLQQISSLLNCEIITHSEVFKIGPSSASGLRQVQSLNHSIDCTLVINCLNGYSVALENYFNDKIYPTRGQIMVFNPVKPFMEGPCYANFYLDYFRQLHDGSLLIGGFRQLEKDTEKGFSEHTTDKIQQALHDFVTRHLPQYKNAQVSHRWAGVMGFSCDGEPMIGSLPSDQQVYFMGGFTGHGLGLAFHGAKTLVDLIFSRPIPHWLSAKRF